MKDLYRHYFKIDPEYFPVVNENVIRDNPELWKKYYPHDTFTALLRDTVDVLTRRQKLNIWVEGEYGSGKSHAVLTLKKLLDADEKETTSYFEKYPQELDASLCQKFLSAKNGGAVLTVHHYGSADVRSTHDLMFAIQDSIRQALVERGMSSQGGSSLKASVIDWLSSPRNAAWFNSLIQEKYSGTFAGYTAESLVEKLRQYSTEKAVLELMSKILHTAHEEGITAMDLSKEGLRDWIQTVIEENQLKMLFFIWDEFTSYFEMNRNTDDFQYFLELSTGMPLCFIIVTHKSSELLGSDRKILGRFIGSMPRRIELPENIAFRLTGAAMEKTSDQAMLQDWKCIAEDLYDHTHSSRELVKKHAHIGDSELKGVLPIHPYTALVLKHMTTAFRESGVRSIFNFLKDNKGEASKNFQYYIDHYGPEEGDENLLTVNMLWDYFYEEGKDGLDAGVLNILNAIHNSGTSQLTKKETEVYKAVLLLQALSQKVGSWDVELFQPSPKNLGNLFEGGTIEGTKACQIADKLVRDHILMEKSMGNGKFVYNAPQAATDTQAIDAEKEKLKAESFNRVLHDFDDVVPKSLTEPPQPFRKRFDIRTVTCDKWDNELKALRNSNRTDSIPVLAVYAKNDTDRAIAVRKVQEEASADRNQGILFIDASLTPLGEDSAEHYYDNKANANYQFSKNKSDSKLYDDLAKKVLTEWKERLEKGDFYLYTPGNPRGERLSTRDAVWEALKTYDLQCYPQSLESLGNVIDNMWEANSLQKGALCGIEQETSGTFRSASAGTKLENLFKEVWQCENYWIEKPWAAISKMKIAAEGIIQKRFAENGRFSVEEIFDLLREKPYGVFPCNLTAFLLGFLLREYADTRYTLTDGVSTTLMSKENLAKIIDEVIKGAIKENSRKRTQYIVSMTEEIRAFHLMTAEAFNFSKERCTSVEETRKYLRNQMSSLGFPLWYAGYGLSSRDCKTPLKVVNTVLDDYMGLANNGNLPGEENEADIATRLGKARIENELLTADLKKLANRESCQLGMERYLRDYREGLLPMLANEIKENGQYITVLRGKFDAQAANWVWSRDTVDRKIDEVILEYRLIRESNTIITPVKSFSAMLSAWQEKINTLRLSYKAAQNSIEGAGSLCEMLYELRKSGSLPEPKREAFLQAMTSQKDAFLQFVNNPLPVFKASCRDTLYGLSEEDIAEIYKQLPTHCYTQEAADYRRTVERAAAEYRNAQAAAGLRRYWQENTGSESPAAWSEQYQMPILCMVPESEYSTAKKALDTVNLRKPDADSLEAAKNYLENSGLFDRLADPETRDSAFRKAIIGTHDVLLQDISEVKRELSHRLSIRPYEWFGHPQTKRAIEEMSAAKYNKEGCVKVLKLIDNMDADSLKPYLKELIKGRMNVGIEILRNYQKK